MPINVLEIGRGLWRVLFVVAAFLLSTAAGYPANVPLREFISVPLRSLAQGDMGKYWTLKSAELHETPGATWGYVELQSVSNIPVADARFYGEYFDADGGFCFSLVFSLGINEEGQTSPIRPGEVRTLRSMAGFLSPGVAPRELRLYLVEQTSLTRQRVEGVGTPAMRVPIIIAGGITKSLASLTLKGELAPPNDSIQDLVLARVRVGIEGRVEEVDILDAVSDKLRQWFQEYVSEARLFAPASRGGIPEAADMLILIRAVGSRSAFENSDFLPRLSRWVTGYVAHMHHNEVVPISTLFFQPAPTRIKRLGSEKWGNLPPPPPGLFSVLNDGTGWCPDQITYKAGQVSGQFVPEWRK